MARGPARPAHKDRACRINTDCALLGTLCPVCAPCTPTWREAGNQAAYKRIESRRAIVDCAMPSCKGCSTDAHWLGTRAVCVKGQCRAENEVRLEQDRLCQADRDCAFHPDSGCGCPRCGVTWRRACTRKHAAWLRHEYAQEQCPRVKCARCNRPVKWIGRKVACRQQQCVVVP